MKKRKRRQLWRKAVLGDMDALAMVGAMLYRGGGKNKRFGKACIKRAMDMGSERAYLIYHRLFSRGKKLIDDPSYEEMVREYREITGAQDVKRTKILEGYLRLGTKQQLEVWRDKNISNCSRRK